MATLREISRSARNLPIAQISRQAYPLCFRRSASAQAASPAPQSPDLLDIETDSSLGAPPASDEDKKEFRPWKRAANRKRALPSGRYQYHPPKYYRGPLHPLQCPPSSDPTARDFVPGPFNVPRLKETYYSTIASDLMTLAYNHMPPGTPKPERAERLRRWEGESPYMENRARRGPRGHSHLPIIEQNITFRNIPAIKEITVATYQPKGIKDADVLVVARTALMAITGALPEMTEVAHNVAQWHIQKGKRSGCKVTIYGNDAYEFLDRCIHTVFPKIKDWPGVKGSTGDGAGNISWGFTPDQVALFPEIEINSSMYPTKMIPGCRVFVKTTATADRQARLLLQSLGMPFYGELKK